MTTNPSFWRTHAARRIIAIGAVVPSLVLAQRPGASVPRGTKQASGALTSDIREQTADQQVMQVL
ncbi:MAG TPA: hypothetical protein VN602_09240, partial [Gemmatimonadaceae bacterium]|nr:hypothetical protein [Gemmatimonadaceae bacterium]